MGPTEEWIGDWLTPKASGRERKVAEDLVGIFAEFWRTEDLEEKSKTTRRRYSDGLHVLGRYLIERCQEEHQRGRSARELVWHEVEPDDGPLIHHDNEAWQRELDTVCRKLRKYLLGQS